MAQERDDGPGSCHDSEGPKSSTCWKKLVNIWVRLLLRKHKMFPFLCEQGGHGAAQQLPGFIDMKVELECLNEIANEMYVSSLV